METYATLFFKGLAIGFAIAAPVGPIGILCIRRTLAYGMLAGLISGLGAATADAMYGVIAGFGLSFVSTFLMQQHFWLTLGGALFLGFMGFKIFLAVPSPQSIASKSGGGIVAMYLSTLFLTLSNPITLLAFTAVFASFGITDPSGDYRTAGVLVAGVFLGSALWWLFLSGLVGIMRSKFDHTLLYWVNKISGIVLIIFAVTILISLRQRIIILPH